MRGRWLAIAAPAALALVCFWPALRGGLLSDDYLLGSLLDDSGGTLSVRWDLIAADFARPWRGMESAFYRPLLSVSLGLDLWLGGGAPWILHATNLLLHVGVAAMTAAMCALCCRNRPALAALCGGALVAVHPVAGEPVAWIAARNSGLEVFFRTAALCAFAFRVHRRSRGAGIAAWWLGAAALASKESAIVLPVSMLAIDVLAEPRRPWRERIALHAPFVPLWIGYAALRLWLFGTIAGGEVASANDLGRGFVSKVAALLAPDAGLAGALALLPVGALVAVWVWRDRGARAVTALGAVWLALHFAPTFALEVHPGLSGARMVYDALPALAIVATRAVDGLGRRGLALGAFALSVGLSFGGSRAVLDRYRVAWREMQLAERGLLELSADVGEDVPLALINLPVAPRGVPPCNPNAWFGVAERPVQPRDLATVSLGFVTVRVPRSEELYGDAGPLRALWQHGARLLSWQRDAGRFAVRQRPAAIELPALDAVPGQPGSFRFAAPVSADWIALVTVRSPTRGARGGRVTWRTTAPLPDALAGQQFGPGVDDDLGTLFTVDLTHHVGLPSLATVGLPVLGFDIELEAPAIATRISAGDRLPELSWPHEPLAGRRITLAELKRLRAPAVDPRAGRLRLVLAGPHSALPIAAAPGNLVRVPADIATDMLVVAGIARRSRYWCWFETLVPPGQPGASRSAVDWFELAPTRD